MKFTYEVIMLCFEIYIMMVIHTYFISGNVCGIHKKFLTVLHKSKIYIIHIIM